MGARPSSQYSIERIDDNGPYAPDNCKWATDLEQANNMRSNHLLTFNDETHTISEWTTIMRFKRSTIGARLSRGWSVEEALTLPPFARHHQGQDIVSVIGVK
jgi:hypothetical protein